MLFHEQSEDYQPLFWMGGRPIYVNTLILILHVAAFTLTALAVAFLGSDVLSYLTLGNYEVLHGWQAWRLLTYIIFPPSWAITFIFAMGFQYYFGQQVEQFVGRKTYTALYAALIFIPAFLLCAVGPLGFWENYLGGYGCIFGVFIAFATIYPGVEINIWFVNLSAKYWAYALLAVLTLANLAGHSWISLSALWFDAAIGYFGMRYIGAGRGFEWLTDWMEQRRAEKLARKRNIRVLEEKKATESIDAILDKISKHGVSSLDASERAALENARTKLLKRDQR